MYEVKVRIIHGFAWCVCVISPGYVLYLLIPMISFFLLFIIRFFSLSRFLLNSFLAGSFV